MLASHTTVHQSAKNCEQRRSTPDGLRWKVESAKNIIKNRLPRYKLSCEPQSKWLFFVSGYHRNVLSNRRREELVVL